MPDTPNNRDNTWYQRKNRIKLRRNERNKRVIFETAQTRASGLGKTIETGARTALTISQLFIDEPNSELEFTLSKSATIKWQADDTPSYGSSSAMDATTGASYASGTFAATVGIVTEVINLTAVPSGNRYMHVYADDGSRTSAVRSILYTQT